MNKVKDSLGFRDVSGQGQSTIESPILLAQGVATGLEPTTPRKDEYREQQRVEAINLVTSRAQEIIDTGIRYEVDPRAIAGAILWEALENPYDDQPWEENYRHPGLRNGPGKVHVFTYKNPFKLSEAEKVENEGLVRPIVQTVPIPLVGNIQKLRLDPSIILARGERLQDPSWAIVYIAAILSRHASDYQEQGFYIRNNPGVLCTLYQGGNSEERSDAKAKERKAADEEREAIARRGGDPSSIPPVQPQPADNMGPWVVKNLSYIQALLRQGSNDFNVTTGEGRI